MKLTQLLPIVLATVTMGWAGKITASQVNKPSSLRITVKDPKLEPFCPLEEKFMHRRDGKGLAVLAYLLDIEYEKVSNCFNQNTILEVDTLTKTQREALQLLKALIKDRNSNTVKTYPKYSIEVYEKLYLAFEFADFSWDDDIVRSTQRALFEDYKAHFLTNNVFNIESFTQYLETNYESDCKKLFVFTVTELKNQATNAGLSFTLGYCSRLAELKTKYGHSLQELQDYLTKHESENPKRAADTKFINRPWVKYGIFVLAAAALIYSGYHAYRSGNLRALTKLVKIRA